MHLKKLLRNTAQDIKSNERPILFPARTFCRQSPNREWWLFMQ
jgi:hypothetical protein